MKRRAFGWRRSCLLHPRSTSPEMPFGGGFRVAQAPPLTEAHGSTTRREQMGADPGCGGLDRHPIHGPSSCTCARIDWAPAPALLRCLSPMACVGGCPADVFASADKRQRKAARSCGFQVETLSAGQVALEPADQRIMEKPVGVRSVLVMFRTISPPRLIDSSRILIQSGLLRNAAQAFSRWASLSNGIR
jgi:hypothetical protein